MKKTVCWKPCCSLIVARRYGRSGNSIVVPRSRPIYRPRGPTPPARPHPSCTEISPGTRSSGAGSGTVASTRWLEFLESGTLQAADEDTRRLFWQWLHQNRGGIAARERPKLAEIAVWPDENGWLCTVAELCDPNARRIGMVLGDSIRRPHEQVRRSKLVSTGRKARTSIRRVPTKDEISHWLNTQTAGFLVADRADAATTEKLSRFETDLTVLLSNTAIAGLLKTARITLSALARDGSIQSRTALVMPNSRNDRLALSNRFVLSDQRYASVLDKLSPALEAPTAAMLLDTFSEDPENFLALHS